MPNTDIYFSLNLIKVLISLHLLLILYNLCWYSLSCRDSLNLCQDRLGVYVVKLLDLNWLDHLRIVLDLVRYLILNLTAKNLCSKRKLINWLELLIFEILAISYAPYVVRKMIIIELCLNWWVQGNQRRPMHAHLIYSLVGLLWIGT